MNPFGKPVKNFFATRGFKYKKSFTKFFRDQALLLDVSFRPIKNAFDGKETLGHALSMKAYYPRAQDFFLVSPDELRDLRKDGTLRHVVYVTEVDGIYGKAETDLVVSVLSDYFDFWEEKIVTPESALNVLCAFRGRAAFPGYLDYLNEFVAKDEQQKLQFTLRRQASVWPFDGGVNFLSFVAYLNAAKRFQEASDLIDLALSETYFEGVRHAPVVMDDTLEKLHLDAKAGKVMVSDDNARALRELGHLNG